MRQARLGEKADAALKAIDERKQLQSEADFAFLLSHEQGRRFLYELIYERCRLEEPTPTGPDGLRYEGRRSIGHEVNRDARVLFENNWQQMRNEGDARLVQDSLHRRAALATSEEDDNGD